MQTCTKCVLPATFPGIIFDEEGVCNYCREYAAAELSNEQEKFSNNALIEQSTENKLTNRKLD